MKTWYKKVIDRMERVAGKRFYTLRESHDLHAARAMDVAGGNISEAARLLDVDRRSLQRKIARIKRSVQS